MRRIEKIDSFTKINPTKYGLEAEGDFFEIIEEMYIECIESYAKDDKDLGMKGLKPVWVKMKALPGDVLVVNKNSSYIFPKGEEGCMECKPSQILEDKDPEQKFYPSDKLVKLGKGIMKFKSLPFQDRTKITLSRPI